VISLDKPRSKPASATGEQADDAEQATALDTGDIPLAAVAPTAAGSEVSDEELLRESAPPKPASEDVSVKTSGSRKTSGKGKRRGKGNRKSKGRSKAGANSKASKANATAKAKPQPTASAAEPEPAKEFAPEPAKEPSTAPLTEPAHGTGGEVLGGHDFFQSGEEGTYSGGPRDSFGVVEEEDDDVLFMLSAEQLARRARLRRYVGAGVALLALVACYGVFVSVSDSSDDEAVAAPQIAMPEDMADAAPKQKASTANTPAAVSPKPAPEPAAAPAAAEPEEPAAPVEPAV